MMEDAVANSKAPYTPGRAGRFYVPLFLQAFSQCLTYPLVAAIVTHGPLGVRCLTGFAQGQTLMFMIGAIAGGLPMTGMVFSRSRKGFAAFQRLNRLMMAVLLVVGIVLALPPVGPWIFTRLLNLPSALSAVACRTLGWGAVMQAGFFLRNEPFVLLMNERRSFEANLATLIRVGVTALSPLVFLPLGLTGDLWGLVAMTGPVWLETVFTWYFARKIPKTLPEKDPQLAAVHVHSHYYDESPSVKLRSWGQFLFTMPLSLGYFLLAASPFVLAAFVGRTADAVMMLSVHYITVGVFNPFGFGSLRMQAVQIQFPPEYAGDRRLVTFAAAVGLLLGACVLVLALPGVSDWYFGAVQNLPDAYLGRARCVMLIYAFLPIVQCVRGRAEGLAALMKAPRLVMYGQIGFIAMMVLALSTMLYAGVPGWLMGALGFTAAIWTCTVLIHLGLYFKGVTFSHLARTRDVETR